MFNYYKKFLSYQLGRKNERNDDLYKRLNDIIVYAQALEHVMMLKFQELISRVHFGPRMDDDLRNEMLTTIFEMNSDVNNAPEGLLVP